MPPRPTVTSHLSSAGLCLLMLILAIAVSPAAVSARFYSASLLVDRDSPERARLYGGRPDRQHDDVHCRRVFHRRRGEATLKHCAAMPAHSQTVNWPEDEVVV
jgi:hypothetical protein